MPSTPNEIEIELDNGMRIKAPTEAWVLGILHTFQKIPGAFEEVIKYLEANKTDVVPSPDLHTADGKRVHFMKGVDL